MVIRTAFVAASLVLAAFHLYTGVFGVLESFTQRSAHLLLVAVALFAATFADREGSRFWRAAVLASAAMLSISLLYNIWYGDFFASRMAYVTPLGPVSIGLALLGMAGLLVISMRVLGTAFAVIVAAFIVYVAIGQFLPGELRHRGFSLSWTVDHLYYTKEGVFGIPLGVSSTYIYLFVLFGAVLDRCGGGKFMIDLAMALTGRFRGGPAKAAVVSSAMMGTISGSAVANVVTTGAVTIPLMKRNGYRPTFAAAVEAAASSGGQLMPPVMGATAFVIAEFVGRPYSEIALSAVIPAFLFYLSIFMAVHFEALRTGIMGSEGGPRVMGVLREGGLYLLPLVVIAYSVFIYSPMRAGLYGVLAVLLVAMVYAVPRGDLAKLPRWIVEGTIEAAKAIGPVAIACASSGIIVGILSLTGLGITINGAILGVAGHSLTAALVLTMVSSLILGMGLPTIAAYLVQVGVTIPALVSLGVEPIPAHLFVFYFAILGNVTPPVAVAAYAAAAIAGSNPDHTGWRATAISLPAFIVPFLFVMDPVLLLKGGVLEIILALATATIGVVALAAAMVGYVFVRLGWVSRAILAAGALLMLYPGLVSDLAGLGLVVLALAPAWWMDRQHTAAANGDAAE